MTRTIAVGLELDRLLELGLAGTRPGPIPVTRDVPAHRDPGVVKPPAKQRALERLVRDGRDDVERGDELDAIALEREVLGHPRRDEVALSVVDDHMVAGRPLPLGHHLFGSQHPGQRRVGPGDRLVGRRVEPVPGPVGARCDDDELRAVGERGLGVELEAGQHFDVVELLELDPTPVDDPRPLAEPGAARVPSA